MNIVHKYENGKIMEWIPENNSFDTELKKVLKKHFSNNHDIGHLIVEIKKHKVNTTADRVEILSLYKDKKNKTTYSVNSFVLEPITDMDGQKKYTFSDNWISKMIFGVVKSEKEMHLLSLKDNYEQYLKLQKF